MWNHEIETTKIGMQQFVKQYINSIPNTDSMILALKRFERLKLDCLHLDRRYLEVAMLFEKELVEIKDT